MSPPPELIVLLLSNFLNIMRSTLLSSRWRECTILVGLPTAINTRRRRRITSESDTERHLAGRAASTATSMMSCSRSQGTEVMIVTGDVPSRAFTRHHGEFSVMGTIFNPAVREATSSLYKLHSSEDRTHTQFPQIAMLEGGLAADRWR